jgi:tetratricopeptide (TPR) repeat protein
MWKMYCVLMLVVVLGLTACGPSHLTKSEGHPAAVPASSAPDAALASQQLADAKKLVADKNWPEAIKALHGISEANSFSRLSGDLQHEVLTAAGEAALYHGPPKLAYEYFARATSLPQAGFDDWLGRLLAADKVGNTADSVSTLTVLVQRWPDRSKQFRPRYILNVIDEAKQSGRDSALPLLHGLYEAHWKLKWDIEPSRPWRDLTLRLVEKGRLAQAIDVAAHITDTYVLISMRADRRFDAVIAANAAQFDIDAAAKRELRAFQAAAESAPESLELQLHLIEALLSQQHYEAALAACDSVVLSIRSTNYPAKLYIDYDEYYIWILDERRELLERLGRSDEAVVQLTAASSLLEDHAGNVSQLINLGQLYCDLNRPKEALEAIGRVVAKTSRYGTTALESVRLDAASQLGDSVQAARSMQYLEEHRADAPKAYEDALIVANQPDRAAKLLLERLRDKDQRPAVLASVQTYAVPPRTPRKIELEVRWRTVLARQDVHAAIQQVGRVEQYKLEER